MRKYKNLPHPIDEPEEFNQYLRDNNEVVGETNYWLTVKNSYIEGQLVAFCKMPVKDALEMGLYAQDLSVMAEPGTPNYYRLRDIVSDVRTDFLLQFAKYDGKHIYINADEDKSIPNRFHIHIKMGDTDKLKE